VCVLCCSECGSDESAGVGHKQPNVLTKETDLRRVFRIELKDVQVVEKSQLQRAVVTLNKREHRQTNKQTNKQQTKVQR
jgi:hypothetical protein